MMTVKDIKRRANMPEQTYKKKTNAQVTEGRKSVTEKVEWTGKEKRF